MAKKKDNEIQKRNVLEELLGSLPVKKSAKAAKTVASGKAAKTVASGKAAKPATAQVRRETSTVYKPEQRITVLRERECRAGTIAEQCWVLVRKSKTIGDYLSLRKKNDMGDGIGGWFGNFVKNKFISLR